MTETVELPSPECDITLEFLFWTASPPVLATPKGLVRCPPRKPGFSGEGEPLEFACHVADRLWGETFNRRRRST